MHSRALESERRGRLAPTETRSSLAQSPLAFVDPDDIETPAARRAADDSPAALALIFAPASRKGRRSHEELGAAAESCAQHSAHTRRRVAVVT